MRGPKQCGWFEAEAGRAAAYALDGGLFGPQLAGVAALGEGPGFIGVASSTALIPLADAAENVGDGRTRGLPAGAVQAKIMNQSIKPINQSIKQSINQ